MILLEGSTNIPFFLAIFLQLSPLLYFLLIPLALLVLLLLFLFFPCLGKCASSNLECFFTLCRSLFPITFLSLNFTYKFHLYCCLCAEHSWDNNIWAWCFAQLECLVPVNNPFYHHTPLILPPECQRCFPEQESSFGSSPPSPFVSNETVFFKIFLPLCLLCSEPFFLLCDVFDVLCVWLKSLWLWMLPAILSLLIFFNLPLIKFI